MNTREPSEYIPMASPTSELPAAEPAPEREAVVLFRLGRAVV